MHKRRQVTRTDGPQAEIVKVLREAGCRVEIIGRPVDLLVQCPAIYVKGYIRLWQPLEIKDVIGKRAPKPRLDKRQKAQAAFLEETATPIATTPAEALRVLGIA